VSPEIRHEPAGWPQYHQGFIGWGETGGHGLTAPGAFNVTQTFIMMSGYSDTGPEKVPDTWTPSE